MSSATKGNPGKLRERKTKLDEIDKEILRLKLKKPTISMAELSSAVGMARKGLWLRIKEEVFQDALAYHQLSAIEIITRGKQRAAQKYEQLIDSEVDSVARQVCEGFLADVLPPKNIAVAHTGTVKHIYSMNDEALLEEIEEISYELGVDEFALQARSVLGSRKKATPPRAHSDADRPGATPG
jgi:hypothetical protein